MSKLKTVKRPNKTLTYKAKHFISLEVSFSPGDGKKCESFFGLNFIESEDEEENDLLDGDHGKYGCWDADVVVKEHEVVCSGSDGPGGGSHVNVVIRIPKTLLKSFKIT